MRKILTAALGGAAMLAVWGVVPLPTLTGDDGAAQAGGGPRRVVANDGEGYEEEESAVEAVLARRTLC